MIKINFSPVNNNNTELQDISVKGRTLTINEEVFDFSFMNEGDILPKEAINSEHFTEDVLLSNSILEVTIRLPHGTEAPREVRFPESILVQQDGIVEFPRGTE